MNKPRPKPRAVREDGFALPFTIFLVTLITLMLASAFSRTATEMQISSSADASVTAAAVAQGGLRAFLADTFSIRPTPGDSFRYNVTGGYAWVLPQVVQMPADTFANDIIYAVRSAGYVIEPTQGSVPQAQRTVVQFARWYTPSPVPVVPAVFNSINGIYQTNIANTFNVRALNGCGSLAPPIRTLNVRGSSTPPMDTALGNSALVYPVADSIAAWSGVNWSQVAAGNFAADYNSIRVNDTTYSTQIVNGNATLTMPQGGTGLLIVTNDLYINGSGGAGSAVDWRGVILVGGYVKINAEHFNLHGLLVTSLNVPYLPLVPDTLAGLNANFWYNPCDVTKTLNGLRGFVALANTFVDNWATY